MQFGKSSEELLTIAYFMRHGAPLVTMPTLLLVAIGALEGWGAMSHVELKNDDVAGLCRLGNSSVPCH